MEFLIIIDNNTITGDRFSFIFIENVIDNNLWYRFFLFRLNSSHSSLLNITFIE